MPAVRLCPCPHCSRHVRSSEVECPFCRGAVRFDARVATTVVHVPRTRRAFVAFSGSTLFGALSASSCRETPSTVPLTPEAPRPEVSPPPPAPVYNEGWDTSSAEDGRDGGTKVPIYGAPAPPIYQYVIFEKDSHALGPHANDTLRELKASLDDDDCNVTIEGHADEFEDDPEKLSKKRTEAVRSALVSLGMPRSRLKAVWFGATRQRDRSVHTYTLNRRVEFKGNGPDGGRCE